MRLVVLGPAFGCPSIDAQCNAAVALLRLWSERSGRPWELTCATSDFDSLPELQHNEKTYHGFRSIAHFLPEDGARLQLDEFAVSSHERDDHLTLYRSLAAFLESNSQSLIDISHYVSYENYADQTRPSFSKILPWPANYILPPHRRNAAKRRTEHLGISGIDMDDVHDSVIDRPPEEMSLAEKRYDNEAEKRARTLLGRQRTLRSMLRRPNHAGAFRLKNLADSVYEPLEAELGAKLCSIGDSLTANDCLAWGYLSLLMLPNMPQSWASEIMRSRYPRLVKYVESISERLGLVKKEGWQAIAFVAHESDLARLKTLPWSPPQSQGILAHLSQLGSGIFSQLPFSTEGVPIKNDDHPALNWVTVEKLLPHTLASAAATVVLSSYLLYRNGMWPTGQAVHIFGTPRVQQYQGLGNALSVLGALSPRGT